MDKLNIIKKYLKKNDYFYFPLDDIIVDDVYDILINGKLNNSNDCPSNESVNIYNCIQCAIVNDHENIHKYCLIEIEKKNTTRNLFRFIFSSSLSKNKVW